MKNIQFDLNLFGGNANCAAEQFASVSCDDIPQRNYSEMNADKENPTKAMEHAYGDNGLLERIAGLLGLEGVGEEALIKAIKARRAKEALKERLRRRNADRTYKALLSEAQQLSSKVNGFDLRTELSNRRFKALLHSGFSVEEAWRAIHINELVRAAEENAKREAVAKAIEKIRKNSTRPGENGSAGKAPSHSKTSVQNLSSKGIRDILRRVENGAKIKF